jgi:hypothetical protein
MVHVLKFGRFVDLEKTFWNHMFEKELPKYKDVLNAIFTWLLFKIINVNTSSSHIFNHL